MKKYNLKNDFQEIVETELSTVNEIIKGSKDNKFVDFSAMTMTDMDDTTNERSVMSQETSFILNSIRERGLKSVFNHRYRQLKVVEPFKKF